MIFSRPSPKRLLLWGTALVFIGVALAATATVLARPPVIDSALDPSIPNAQTLIARGLTGTPGPGQPTAPIAVDRVLTDGAATYVQFHSTTALGHAPDTIPELYDNTGALVNYGGSATTAPTDATWARFIPWWFPWHPPTGPLRGVVTLGPLPLTAHAAVLGFMNGETVRVPLNLTALRHIHTYRGQLVQRNNLQFQVAAVWDTRLVLGFSPVGSLRGVTLVDEHGHGVPLKTVSSGGCSSAGFPDIHNVQLACRALWAYPPQPHSSRLTLVIQSFVTDSSSVSIVNGVGPGPWRYTFTMP